MKKRDLASCRCRHVKKGRRRGEILRTGRAPLVRESLRFRVHLCIRYSCSFPPSGAAAALSLPPSLVTNEREGNLIFSKTTNVRPSVANNLLKQHPPVYRWFVYLSVVIGKVAKQVGQRWRGLLRYVVSVDNEHREKFEFEELEKGRSWYFCKRFNFEGNVAIMYDTRCVNIVNCCSVGRNVTLSWIMNY